MTENLRRLAVLLDDGTIQAHAQDTYQLDRASDALQNLATEHVQGKLAISVP
jgi:NADPH:quinone reductase-like Zn-dependent oxidoreductase